MFNIKLLLIVLSVVTAMQPPAPPVMIWGKNL